MAIAEPTIAQDAEFTPPRVEAAQRPLTVDSGDRHVAILDGLRGIAILAVVWYHAWLLTGFAVSFRVFGWHASLQTFAKTGYLGVDLFFFVSGFCLFYPYARALFEGRTFPTVREFAKRRALKILPSYFLALTVFTLLYHDQFASWAQLGRHYAMHAMFAHPWFFDTFGSISGPLWTLGIEVQFYVLFPLICLAFCRWPAAVYALLVGIALAFRNWVGSHGFAQTLFATDQLPAVIDLFASGMLAAFIVVRLRSGSWKLDRARGLFALLTLVSIVGAYVFVHALAALSNGTDMSTAYAWLNDRRFLLAAAFIGIAVGASFGFRWTRLIVAHPALVFFATISYNLYLWHLEIIVQLQRLLAGAAGHWILFAIGPVIAIAVAILITFALERPLLKLGRARRPARAARPIRVIDGGRKPAVWWHLHPGRALRYAAFASALIVAASLAPNGTAPAARYDLSDATALRAPIFAGVAPRHVDVQTNRSRRDAHKLSPRYELKSPPQYSAQHNRADSTFRRITRVALAAVVAVSAATAAQAQPIKDATRVQPRGAAAPKPSIAPIVASAAPEAYTRPALPPPMSAPATAESAKSARATSLRVAAKRAALRKRLNGLLAYVNQSHLRPSPGELAGSTRALRAANAAPTPAPNQGNSQKSRGLFGHLCHALIGARKGFLHNLCGH